MSKLTIKKGRRRAFKWPLWLTTDNEIKARAAFHQSCRYDIGEDQSDWNKLIGRTSNGIFPHRNSMRLAWRYVPSMDMIELGAYTYRRGIRQTEPQGHDCHIAYVNLSEAFEINMHHERFKYVFSIRIKGKKYKKKMPAKEYKRNQLFLRLGAYFGGNKKAPHNINMTIEIL